MPKGKKALHHQLCINSQIFSQNKQKTKEVKSPIKTELRIELGSVESRFVSITTNRIV